VSRSISFPAQLMCFFFVASSLISCGTEEVKRGLFATVKRGPLLFSGSFYGELEARESIAIHTPDLSGINSLTVDSVLADGTKVKKGDTVLSFIKGPVADELRDNESELAVAKAEMRRIGETLATERTNLELTLQSRKLEIERAKLNVVVGVNFISKLELAKAKLDLKKAELKLSLAKKALHSFAKKRKAALEVQRLKVAAIQDKVDQKRKNLVAMDIKAPAGGVLFGPHTRLNWVRGKVMPGSVTRGGDKLLEIPDLKAYNVALYLRQRDVGLLKKGDKATVFATMLPDVELEGKVVRKEDFATTRNERLGTKSAEGNLKEVKVIVELTKAPEALRPGGSVRADLKTTLADDVLQLPLAALDQTKKGYQVIMADGKKRLVDIGRSSATHAEIVKGLAVGDKVRIGRHARTTQKPSASRPGRSR
jgi:HlyD family secretion protein